MIGLNSKQTAESRRGRGAVLGRLRGHLGISYWEPQYIEVLLSLALWVFATGARKEGVCGFPRCDSS